MRRSIRCSIRVLILAAAMLSGSDGARAEAFGAVYVGGAVTGDAGSSIRGGPAAGPLIPLVNGERTEFDLSVAPGGRAGYWLESLPWLGFALDVSYFQVDQTVDVGGKSVFDIRVTPFSGLLMLRYQLLKNSAFPHGGVNFYGAAGPGLFRSKFSGLGASDTSLDVGADVHVGVEIFHVVQSWGFFAEYRFTRFTPSTFKGDNSGGVVQAEFNALNTNYFLFGTSFHF